MATQFAEGRYLVRIVNQFFTESPTKATPGFVLAFRVVRSLDEPDLTVKAYQRDMTWWLTPKTVRRALHDLHVLGYEGKDLDGVDPDNDSRVFHDFKDQEIELICTHETSSEGVFERWSLPNSKPRLQDKSQLRKLDRLLNPEPARVDSAAENDLGITDEDVPF
jgi:hypothetical protein